MGVQVHLLSFLFLWSLWRRTQWHTVTKSLSPTPRWSKRRCTWRASVHLTRWLGLCVQGAFSVAKEENMVKNKRKKWRLCTPELIPTNSGMHWLTRWEPQSPSACSPGLRRSPWRQSWTWSWGGALRRPSWRTARSWPCWCRSPDQLEDRRDPAARRETAGTSLSREVRMMSSIWVRRHGNVAQWAAREINYSSIRLIYKCLLGFKYELLIPQYIHL